MTSKANPGAAGRGGSQPIIVIGMHRSGTGLLAGILRDLGVHMGFRREANQESTFFLRLNEELLRATGASWDRPEPLLDLLREEGSLEDRLVADVGRRLASLAAISYLGPRRFLACRSIAGLDGRWGWKDPRNTLTLPLWLKLFPAAKVIHIYRNGVDVAASLKARSDAYSRRRENGLGIVRALSRLRGIFYPRVRDSGLCRTLDAGFGLWETYTGVADAHLAGLGEGRRLAISYERLATQPAAHLETLCRFTDSACDRKTLDSITARLAPSRAFRYEADAELRAFYEAVRERPQMKQYSYA